MQNEREADSRLLDPVAATEYCPGLRSNPFKVTNFASNVGYADPHLALQGFAEATREAGADIHTRRPATGLRTSPDQHRVTGVDTPERPLDGEYVVNAAGSWSGPIAEMVDANLPVAPKRRSIAIVDQETPIRETVGITIDLDRVSYFRSERESNALVCGKFYRDDPTHHPDRYVKGHGCRLGRRGLG
jgi:sarcosine oxidase subunit beta